MARKARPKTKRTLDELNRFSLFRESLDVAKQCIGLCMYEDQNGGFFDVDGYLELLRHRLDEMRFRNDEPCGGFEIDWEQVARFLWCCVALERGDAPDGSRFRGMEIAEPASLGEWLDRLQALDL